MRMRCRARGRSQVSEQFAPDICEYVMAEAWNPLSFEETPAYLRHSGESAVGKPRNPGECLHY